LQFIFEMTVFFSLLSLVRALDSLVSYLNIYNSSHVPATNEKPYSSHLKWLFSFHFLS
jgi:hypothetical protein